MGVAVETGDTEADGELKPMGKFCFYYTGAYFERVLKISDEPEPSWLEP